MVRVRYLGLHDPTAAFLDLEPYRTRLIRMACSYRPGGREYQALHKAVEALDVAAEALTGKPGLLGLKAHTTPAGDAGRRK